MQERDATAGQMGERARDIGRRARETVQEVGQRAREAGQHAMEAAGRTGEMVEEMPTTAYHLAVGASVLVSALLFLRGRGLEGPFVGLRAPTILSVTIASKLLRPSREVRHMGREMGQEMTRRRDRADRSAGPGRHGVTTDRSTSAKTAVPPAVFEFQAPADSAGREGARSGAERIDRHLPLGYPGPGS